jgi:hypothetical protein
MKMLTIYFELLILFLALKRAINRNGGTHQYTLMLTQRLLLGDQHLPGFAVSAAPPRARLPAARPWRPSVPRLVLEFHLHQEAHLSALGLSSLGCRLWAAGHWPVCPCLPGRLSAVGLPGRRQTSLPKAG